MAGRERAQRHAPKRYARVGADRRVRPSRSPCSPAWAAGASWPLDLRIVRPAIVDSRPATTHHANAVDGSPESPVLGSALGTAPAAETRGAGDAPCPATAGAGDAGDAEDPAGATPGAEGAGGAGGAAPSTAGVAGGANGAGESP